MTQRPHRRGSVLVVSLILLTVLVGLVTAFVVFLGRGRRALVLARAQERGLALAEAGVEKAIWELSRPNATYRGETDTHLGDGFFSVRVARNEGAGEAWTIVATGILADEIDSPAGRRSSVPELTARVEIERFADGRPRRVRVIEWQPRATPTAHLTPRSPPPARHIARPAAGPTTAPATRPAPNPSS